MAETRTLFDPATMGAIELPNRVLMAPLTRNRSQADGTPNAWAQTYYKQRASAGLILAEATQVSAMGKGYKDTPGIHTDAHVREWRKITDAVHAQGGRIFLQLWHVGRISHSSLLPDNAKPLAPSAVRAQQQTFTENGFEDCSEPQAMTIEQIRETVEQFRDGAERAKEAGFDGVEIHAANGYLLDQFLKDGINDRDDDYGGSPEKRMRFVSEVIDAVATVWPRDRIGIRLSPFGKTNDLSDSDPEANFTPVYKMVNDERLAYIHVVEQFPGADVADETFEALKRLRKLWDGFYIGNGGYDKDNAIAQIASGHCDAVTFGRDFIANPDLPERFRVGAELNAQDPDTFYGGDERGYIDYPFLPDGTDIDAQDKAA